LLDNNYKLIENLKDKEAIVHFMEQSRAVRFLSVCLFVLLLTACNQPTYQYAFETGDYKVNEVDQLLLDFEKLGKKLPLRVSYPDADGYFPVIVFSHGNGSKGDMYKGFTDYWASYGYIVFQPTHMDSRSLGFETKRDNLREFYTQMLTVTDTRRQDMSFVLDSLSLIEEMVPELKGKMDTTKLIAAGHSMGAATAMLVSGMKLVNPMDGSEESSEEDRFKTLLMISDPGTMALMPKDPWKGVKIPTFISTGTNDFSTVGSGRVTSPFKYKIPEELTSSAAPHHYVFIDGADHYLGGLICRTDVPGPLQHEALKIAAATSTTFLEAYVRNDQQSIEAMHFGNLEAITSGQATLTTK